MNYTMLTYDSIGEKLAGEIPEFRGVFEEHRKEYQKILPHVLFGDFTRFVIHTYRGSKKNPQLRKVFDKSLNFVEKLLQSRNSRLAELAHVSFLENLHQAGSEYREIKEQLRPISLKQLTLIEKEEKTKNKVL